MKDWDLSIGTYPGLVIGIRSYKQHDRVDHVFYLPLIDLCLTIYKNERTNTTRNKE